MRLLEPINGIKSIQGHYLANLVFFLAMWSINDDISINLREADQYKIDDLGQKLSPLHLQSQDPNNEYLNSDDTTQNEGNRLNLASGGSGQQTRSRLHKHFGEEMDVNSIQHKENEKKVFHQMKWLHLAVFVFITLTFFLKIHGYHNSKQLLQFVVLVSYFCVGWFLVYTVKETHAYWGEDINMVRCWLYIETCYIFIWIFSAMIFMTLAQMFKLKSSVHSRTELKQDESIWSYRDSDDFLRYMKHDFFIVVYIISFLLSNCLWTFNNSSDTIKHLGERNNQIILCAVIFIVLRVLQLIFYGYTMIKGENYMKCRKTSKIFRHLTHVHWFVSFVGIIVAGYLYIDNDMFKGQNVFTRLWIRTQFIAYVCEIPYCFFIYYQKVNQGNKVMSYSTILDDIGPSLNESLINNEQNEGNSDLESKKRSKTEFKKSLTLVKKKLDVEEDFVAMTVLCYLDKNQEELHIHESKQSQMLLSCLLIYATTVGMLACMLYAIATNENGSYTPTVALTFALFFVKFPCTLALHFQIYPKVANGMNLMKFCNNQPHQFVNNGDKIGLVLGFNLVITALLCEAICIYILAYQNSIQYCIMYFVAINIVMNIPNLYFNSLKQNPLKKVVKPENRPEANIRGEDIKFWERSCFHKVARVIYKFFRAIYVGVIFYFIPFSVMWVQWITSNEGGEH